MVKLPEPFDAKLGLRWSVRRRLEFIEFRLFWQGTFNRGDLVEQFGISQQQASADIAAYEERAPGNCTYDRKAKHFVRADRFDPLFGLPDAQTYLNELRSVDSGITTRQESWVGDFPSFATVPYPRRRVDVDILRTFLRAIEVGEALFVLYQSMTRPEPIWRWITPHAIGYDSHRWHTRAFCHLDGNFKDFVFGRVREVQEAVDHQVDPDLDRQWAEEIDLEIGIHPDLPATMREAVKLDHDLVDGRRVVPVRAALMYYLVRWMRADLDPQIVSHELSQIVLLNRESAYARRDALWDESARRIREEGVVRLELP